MPTSPDKRRRLRGVLKALAAMWLGAALAADRDLKRERRRRRALAESIAPSAPAQPVPAGERDGASERETAAHTPVYRRGWVQLWAAMAALALLVIVFTGIAFAQGWFDDGDITGTREGFVASAAPVGASAAASWPGYGFDGERTRANPALAMRPPFRETWSFDAGSLLEFPPVIAQDRAIVGTNAGLGLAVDTSTGQELWRVQLRGRVASSPAITADDLALFTTINGKFVAVDIDTGQVAWRVDLGSGSESSPLVLDGDVYIGMLDGRVMRFDLERRRPVWVANATGEVKASLALSGPNVIVGDYGGNVSAFRRRDGSLAWRTESPSPALRGPGRFYAGPAVAYGRVYVGNINGRVLGLSARTGDISWVRTADDWVYSSAAVANETVFVGSYDEKLYALDAVTGIPKWTFAAGERISGSPSVVGNVVYVSTIGRNPKDGRTFALDVGTGARIWQFPDGRYSPAVAVDGLLVLTGVRTMYGFVPAA